MSGGLADLGFWSRTGPHKHNLIITAMTGLDGEQLQSIKKSYLNVLGLFLGEEQVESRFLRCLLKWGFQLHVGPDDIRQENLDISRLAFAEPGHMLERTEAIYHLVYMICIDRVVEDIELEVAGRYAEKLGFNPTLVSDLVKAIVTADSDGLPQGDIRQQVVDFLRLNGYPETDLPENKKPR